jgi:cyclopropane fatty-acyl-phospholipid synthase-like methyltransferase
MDETQRYQQYLLEKELAARIRAASVDDRPRVIKEAYTRLYSEATWHRALHKTEEQRRNTVLAKDAIFGWALGKGNDVLEIGCGTGEYLAHIAPHQRSCAGVEISTVKAEEFPDAGGNLKFELMEGVRLPAQPDASYDVVFSSQVMEHLHPDDLPLHLSEVYRVLRLGGRYVVDTPSGLNGPHDISKGYDAVATGMHLKEWTYTELTPLLRAAGFSHIKVQVLPTRLLRHWPALASLGTWPVQWKIVGEKLVHMLPPGGLRDWLIRVLVLYALIVIAAKDKR